MKQQTILDHFSKWGGPTLVAKIFACTRNMVYQWANKEHVPEVVSLRADFLTNGELPHDPADYGLDYKRGDYSKKAMADTENMPAE
jgi:hypothetical protein